jgi:hypothetical protein
MQVVAGMAALLLIFFILQDAFETIVLPRRVSRRFRLARGFIVGIWGATSGFARWLPSRRARETYLAVYGPLALLLLLILWATALIFGFGVLQWALGSHLATAVQPVSFGTDLYMSGTTIFTLGLGDVAPLTPLARVITVVEAGTGFGFLALVIGYLPVLYQSFSRREVTVSLLDARAGSPPSAVELLRRACKDDAYGRLNSVLAEWERWSAEVLESHLSYPVLAYFRSQHENQSWLAALSAILDACALVMAGIEGVPSGQAQLTFAMARHAVVDLSQTLYTAPNKRPIDRLPPKQEARVRAALAAVGLRLRTDEATRARLADLRALYEPYILSLAHHLLMDLPLWLPRDDAADAWETSAYEVRPAATDAVQA